MAALKIKFSHNYPKLARQKSAELIAVRMKNRADLVDSFVLYDTHYIDETIEKGLDGYYPLPNGLVMVLYFIGDRGIPFSTVRRATGQKELYYRANIGRLFDIEIVIEGSTQDPQHSATLPAAGVAG